MVTEWLNVTNETHDSLLSLSSVNLTNLALVCAAPDSKDSCEISKQK